MLRKSSSFKKYLWKLFFVMVRACTHILVETYLQVYTSFDTRVHVVQQFIWVFGYQKIVQNKNVLRIVLFIIRISLSTLRLLDWRVKWHFATDKINQTKCTFDDGLKFTYSLFWHNRVTMSKRLEKAYAVLTIKYPNIWNRLIDYRIYFKLLSNIKNNYLRMVIIIQLVMLSLRVV